MQLIDDMRARLGKEESIFRQQLLKEDVARLEKLADLAAEHDGVEAFTKAGMMIGWTQGDMRTLELREQLEPFLSAFYASAHAPGDSATENGLVDAWIAFNNRRMEKMVGCLSRPG